MKGRFYNVYQSSLCVERPLTIDHHRISADHLQESLILSPDKEQKLFQQRDQFDLIVIYDQDTTTLNSYTRFANKKAQDPLRNLVAAIYDLAYEKTLKAPPKLLVGGIARWKEYNGPTSLVQTPVYTARTGLARTGARTAGLSQSTIAQRRRERGKGIIPGQILSDVEKSELNNTLPINKEEEEEWMTRLKREKYVP